MLLPATHYFILKFLTYLASQYNNILSCSRTGSVTLQPGHRLHSWSNSFSFEEVSEEYLRFIVANKL